jgi:hypothetical protein
MRAGVGAGRSGGREWCRDCMLGWFGAWMRRRGHMQRGEQRGCWMHRSAPRVRECCALRDGVGESYALADDVSESCVLLGAESARETGSGTTKA